MVCMRLRWVRSVACGCIVCVGLLDEEIVAGMFFLTCVMHRGLQFCFVSFFLSLRMRDGERDR